MKEIDIDILLNGIIIRFALLSSYYRELPIENQVSFVRSTKSYLSFSFLIKLFCILPKSYVFFEINDFGQLRALYLLVFTASII